jgi:hypothetical protein
MIRPAVALRGRRSWWTAGLILLAVVAFVGSRFADRYERRQIAHAVSASGQVERFGDHETYLLVWNDQIFANLVRIPEGWLASLPEGARVRVYYQPQTHQVVLKSRRYDAPYTLIAGGLCCLAAAGYLQLRGRRTATARQA